MLLTSYTKRGSLGGGRIRVWRGQWPSGVLHYNIIYLWLYNNSVYKLPKHFLRALLLLLSLL